MTLSISWRWTRPLAKSKAAGDYYYLLGSPEWGLGPSSRAWVRRRWRQLVTSAVCAVLAIVAIVVYLVLHPEFWRRPTVLKIIGPKVVPPLYPEFREAEALLPQHKSRDPFAGGRKYLWVASHPQWSGWGNYMQDLVFTAHLTYVLGRSFVFDDYTWDRDGVAYSKFKGKLVPSRIPMSALISGPIVGGHFFDGDSTPRAISKTYWDKICPNPRIVHGQDVRAIHGPGANALKILETWRDYFADIDDPCVEVDRESGGIFHVFMFGNKEETLPIWPSLSQSPIITLFGWSTLAHQAFDANRHLFSPVPLIQPYTTAPACPRCIDPHAPLAGLLAVHLRRGDFIEHCENLGHWGAGFNAFNMFPAFPDPWAPPEGDDAARMAVYMRRCLPSIEQVVEKVEAVRATRVGERLWYMYIMTNGEKGWLEELKAALRRRYRWEHIATSRDLVWTLEQKYVSQATDMMIGQRAQVFIGNGFSSMTSNIAMLRMAKDMPPDSTRMW